MVIRQSTMNANKSKTIKDKHILMTDLRRGKRNIVRRTRIRRRTAEKERKERRGGVGGLGGGDIK